MPADKNLLNVEIFSTGRHNGDDYSERDLDDMVEAFSKLDFAPPIKSGHSEDKPGLPALGWVKNLRRVGAKLVADFCDMPDVVYDYIRDKRYNTVSAEVYWNFKRGTNSFRRALKAVALLGAEIPAVAGLKPLHELFSDNEGDVKFGSETKLYEDKRMTEDEMKAAIKAAEDKATADAAAREKAEQEVKKFKEQMDELVKKASANGDVNNAIRDIHNSELLRKFEDLQTQFNATHASVEAERKARAALELQTQADAKRIAELSETQRKSKVAEFAASCKIPALRGFVEQFMDLASQVSSDTKVYNDKGEAMTPTTAAAEFVKFANSNAAKLFTIVSSHGRDVSKDGDDRPDDEVVTRASKYALDHKVSFIDAKQAVMDEDPGLRERYLAKFQGQG